MQTTLTSKGQLVIPKAVRDALHIKPGTKFEVQVKQGRIILKPSACTTASSQQWQPRNPSGRRLGSAELSRPVTLTDE